MTALPPVKETKDGASFAVRVAPCASRTAITGMMGEGADAVLKVALAAPPVEGRANEVLVEYLADLLDLPRSAVEIVAGEQSRNKVVRARGRGAAEVAAALQRLLTDK
jgi:uncharacterized protein